VSGGLLVVTAVAAEADAIRTGLGEAPATVVAVGVGPSAAAANTARLLAVAQASGHPYTGVVSAGIAGGFAGRAPLGATVIATGSVAADLGADSPDGFLPLDELGFGDSVTIPTDPTLVALLRTALPEAITGEVLTVSTVTGTAARAQELGDRHPFAVAEAMEGYAVAVAAATLSVPFAELRTISNTVGPRDRAAWRMGDAFAALRSAFNAVGKALSSPQNG
jgi:futalosine hydrolase